jgi:microcystin degradation protein MlrC
VKAKNHFRAAFGQRCAAIIDCDAPGGDVSTSRNCRFAICALPVH